MQTITPEFLDELIEFTPQDSSANTVASSTVSLFHPEGFKYQRIREFSVRRRPIQPSGKLAMTADLLALEGLIGVFPDRLSWPPAHCSAQTSRRSPVPDHATDQVSSRREIASAMSMLKVVMWAFYSSPVEVILNGGLRELLSADSSTPSPLLVYEIYRL